MESHKADKTSYVMTHKNYKIGILTFHRAENFGAALQCYALQSYLRNEGYDVAILDYRCPPIEMAYHIWNPRILFSRKNFIKSIISYINRFCHYKERKKKKERFCSFRKKYLNIIPISKENIYNLDAAIVGSDQVWSLGITQGIDNYYFLEFDMKKSAKRLSYAASAERNALENFENNKYYIKQALKKFDAISVRENSLKEIISNFTNKKVSVCLDPTFLLNDNVYSKLAIRPNETNYILVYHLVPTLEGIKLANNIAKKEDLKIIEIYAGYKAFKNGNIHKMDLGPQELLGYIRYAQYIITTSFHGLALSLIQNKNVIIIDEGANTRLKDLLKSVDLEDIIISTADEYVQKNIDYNKVEQKLNFYVQKSKDFLLQNLN